MIEHTATRRHLDAYVDDEITDPALAERIARHIADCPMCTDEVNLTRVVKHRLSLRRLLPGQSSHQQRWS